MRSRLPTCWATAWVLSSWAWAGGHRELPLQRHYLEFGRRAGEVPERGLAGGTADADAGRAAVHVVGHVGRLRVAGQGADAAQPGLGKQRMIGQGVIGEQGGQGAGAAAEAQAVDRQHAPLGIHPVAVIAGGGVAARHRFAHDHPQCVGGGNVVAAGKQEAIRERVLGAAVVVTQPAGVGAGQVEGHVVGGVGQRSAEVAGLGVIPEQGKGHGGQETHLLEPVRVVGGDRNRTLKRRMGAFALANSDG